MHRNAALILALLCGLSHAESPPTQTPPAPASDTQHLVYLHQRVAEELAADGHALAARGLRLEIELVGTTAIIALRAISTGVVTASSKVDNVPRDREAAVATLTHAFAAILANELRLVPVAPAPPVMPVLPPARVVPQLSPAERAFQGERLQLSANGGAYRFAPSRGERILGPSEFYALVGRDDLADSYRHRKLGAYALLGVGLAALVAAPFLLEDKFVDTHNAYEATDPRYPVREAEIQAEVRFANQVRSDSEGDAWLAAGVGGTLIVVGVGMRYFFDQPATAAERQALADAYNQKLRARLKLDAKPSSWIVPSTGPNMVGLRFGLDF